MVVGHANAVGPTSIEGSFSSVIFYLHCIPNVACRFPTDERRRERWAARVHRQDNSTGRLWKPKPGAVLCSEHFHPSDFFWQWGRKLVKPDAEPTIFSFAATVNRRKPPAHRSRGSACTGSASDKCEPLTAPESMDTLNKTQSQSTKSDHVYCMKSPNTLSIRIKNVVQKLKEKSAALRNARKRENRLRGKVEDLLKKLKDMQLLTSKAEELLELYKDIPLELLSGKVGRRFTDEQKHFAITLYYYSAAAYKFVRHRFGLLPCPRTIRSWLSHIDGSPGLSLQAFDTIRQKATSTCESVSAEYKLCSIHIDEMEIKKQIDFDRTTGKMHGFTDVGSGMH